MAKGGIPCYIIEDIIRFNRENFAIKTENKSCYVLSCRTSGESLFFYNGREIPVRRGDVLWIPIGSSYSQRCEKESLICFHLSVSGAVSPEVGVFSTQDPDGIIELFKKAERIHRRRPKNHEYLCHSLLYEIIAKSGAGIMADEEKLPPLLAPAVEYINERLFSPDLSVEQAASAAHVSRSYFNRLFKASFGETPAHYISRRRIERAKQFLTVGNYTNSEIAALSGFTDIKYFYAVFKKITGMTTGEYKKKE